MVYEPRNTLIGEHEHRDTSAEWFHDRTGSPRFRWFMVIGPSFHGAKQPLVLSHSLHNAMNTLG